MFILPDPASANALPLTLDFAVPSAAVSAKWLTFGLQLHLPLTLTILATLVVLAFLRFALHVKAGFIPAAVAVTCPEKSEGHEKAEKPSTPAKAHRFRPRFLAWPPPLPSITPPLTFNLPALPQLPALPTLAEALPITLHPPPPPVMRGRHVYRGGRGVGFVQSHQQQQQLGHHVVPQLRRPEPVRRSVAGVEVPLPAIYESQTPVLMAKMIMSRHTHRRPTFVPAPGPSPSSYFSSSRSSSSSSSPLVGSMTRSRSPSP